MLGPVKISGCPRCGEPVPPLPPKDGRFLCARCGERFTRDAASRSSDNLNRVTPDPEGRVGSSPAWQEPPQRNVMQPAAEDSLERLMPIRVKPRPAEPETPVRLTPVGDAPKAVQTPRIPTPAVAIAIPQAVEPSAQHRLHTRAVRRRRPNWLVPLGVVMGFTLTIVAMVFWLLGGAKSLGF